MTRSDDRFIKLRKRTKYANTKGADLFVSIHANAVPKRNAKKAYGIETYFLSNDDRAGSERAKRVAAMENSKDLRDVTYYGQKDFINILNREKIKMSERLAYDLQRNVLAELRKSYKNVKDGGVREGPFWILVGAQMPAVLVEVGFITHPEEAKRLVKRSYQKRFAQGLANGINQYFIYNP
jgi:N-acetylmuramoyl-L-alanine amidase